MGKNLRKSGACLGVRAGELGLRLGQINKGREEMMVWSAPRNSHQNFPRHSLTTCSRSPPQTSLSSLFSQVERLQQRRRCAPGHVGCARGHPKPLHVFLCLSDPKIFGGKKIIQLEYVLELAFYIKANLEVIWSEMCMYICTCL